MVVLCFVSSSYMTNWKHKTQVILETADIMHYACSMKSDSRTTTWHIFMTWVLTLSKWSGLKWIIPNPEKQNSGQGFIDCEWSFNPYLDRCVNEGPQTLAGARRPTRWARRWSQSLASKHLHPSYRSSARSIHPASVANKQFSNVMSSGSILIHFTIHNSQISLQKPPLGDTKMW